MTAAALAEQYFTYEERLLSFQIPHQIAKRRASNASTASSKGSRTLRWPHKSESLSGEELAKAGFFFHPTAMSPDNVCCFLCLKNIDGWEEEDEPLAEHRKHSPDCGWAITASIAAAVERGGDLAEHNPASTEMIEARKATFADRWPHEGKKGWKCKVKQMVDGGWTYTPTPESDDMATCVYCQLALDGWDKTDKPLDEHFKRSEDCAFYKLIQDHKQAPVAKKAKAKGRASKASRLSTQSSMTIAEDATSILEPAAEDDSILTTATNATATRGKKMAKGKKAPAKRTRAKKGEPIEVAEDDNVEVVAEPAAKSSRGKKRKSDEDTELEVAAAEEMAPPPKRRATRTRASSVMNDSIMSQVEVAKPAAKKPRASRSRKPSTASVAPTRAAIPDDDEIDRALEADLARSLTDEEEEQVEPAHSKSHAMFDPEPMLIDEVALDAELEAMEAESKPLPKAKGAKGKQPRKVSAKQSAAAKKAEAAAKAEAERLAAEEASQQIVAELEHSISMQEPSPILTPKKQRASTRPAGARKAPGRATKGSVMSVAEDDIEMTSTRSAGSEQGDDSGNDTDASNASQSTVIRGGSNRRGSTLKAKGGKKGVSRHIEEIVHKAPDSAPVVDEDMLDEEEPDVSTPHMKMVHVEETTVTEEVYYAPLPEEPQPEPMDEVPAPEPSKVKATKTKGRPRKIAAQREPLPLKLAQSVNTRPVEDPAPVETTSTMPGAMPSSPPQSPTPPPKERTPSLSPQSSDAENRPPSSKPSAATKKTATPSSSTRRVPLADTIPGMLSPSKRNIIAGLQSTAPWTNIDLDTVFMKSPSDENAPTNIFGTAIDKAKNGELTSPEKKMTVEEWVKYNAEMAEEKLRGECERMVGLFEREGMRALVALEGVDCVE